MSTERTAILVFECRISVMLNSSPWREHVQVFSYRHEHNSPLDFGVWDFGSWSGSFSSSSAILYSGTHRQKYGNNFCTGFRMLATLRGLCFFHSPQNLFIRLRSSRYRIFTTPRFDYLKGRKVIRCRLCPTFYVPTYPWISAWCKQMCRSALCWDYTERKGYKQVELLINDSNKSGWKHGVQVIGELTESSHVRLLNQLAT